MRQIFYIFFVLLLFVSCDRDHYTITGTIDDKSVDGKIVYIYDLNKTPIVNNMSRVIDSATVTNGKFTFTGLSDHPTIFNVGIPDTYYYATVLSENEEIEVKFYKDTDSPYIVGSSSGLNGELFRLNNHINSITRSIVGARDSLALIYKDEAELNKVHGENFNKLIADEEILIQTVLQQNRDNILGIYCVEKMMGEMTSVQVDSLFSIVPFAKDYNPIKKDYNRIKKSESTDAGSMFVDFPGKSVDGKPAKLSDYVGNGKYVLVDFWASWCGPCSAANSVLKYVHETYPELIVLGVNVWDSETNFHNYIKEHNIQWSMLYASDDRYATEQYGIPYIPTIILFDPQGVIVDRTLHGDDVIKAKISELFD